jgi:hypothetical protein
MADAPSAVQTAARDLGDVFGGRLQSLVHYGARAHDAASHREHGTHGHHEPALVHVLAVVDSLTPDDLRACAARVASWHEAGLATPLIMPAAELARALDTFPAEFTAIVADHAVVSGRNPFDGLRVEPTDLRWACEVQARSHLLHLREGYIETRGRADALAVLIVRSAPAWAALLQNVARLQGAPAGDAGAAARYVERMLELAAGVEDIVEMVGVREISSEQARQAFPSYLDAVERLTRFVDRWDGAK